MATFEQVQEAVRANRVRITEHAREEMAADKVSVAEALSTTLGVTAEVIEDYPNAFPNPACLTLGFLANAAPVHLVWAFDSSSGYAALVTVYRPDPALWTADYRKRVTQ